MQKTLKKGQFQASGLVWALAAVAVAFVVFGLIAAFGQDILSTVGADFTADTYEANSTIDAQDGIENMTSKSPNLGTIIIAGAIIAVLIGAFAYRMTR